MILIVLSIILMPSALIHWAKQSKVLSLLSSFFFFSFLLIIILATLSNCAALTVEGDTYWVKATLSKE